MNAVILIDKPRGVSSQQAVSVVKRRLGVRKAGHTGTLDPIATGLLIVCTGEATKASRFFMELPKIYLATLRLGQRTDTFDSEGKIIAEAAYGADREAFERVLRGFRGRIRQTPPMFSALKVSGTPLYKLARKGIEVERTPREVEVGAIELVRFEPPFAEILVRCSSGTYIRSLADDIGVSFGSYAHVAELRRTAVGPFAVERAVPPDEIFSGEAAEPEGAVFSIDDALGFLLGELRLDWEASRKAANGIPLKPSPPPSEGYLRLKDPSGKLFAIGHCRGGVVRIERLLHL